MWLQRGVVGYVFFDRRGIRNIGVNDEMGMIAKTIEKTKTQHDWSARQCLVNETFHLSARRAIVPHLHARAPLDALWRRTIFGSEGRLRSEI